MKTFLNVLYRVEYYKKIPLKFLLILLASIVFAIFIASFSNAGLVIDIHNKYTNVKLYCSNVNWWIVWVEQLAVIIAIY